MRFAAITIAFILMGCFFACNPTDNSEKVMKKLSEFYNKKDYHSLYLMLAPEFRTQMPEDKLTSFYKDNLIIPYGNIVSWKVVSKVGELRYVVQMDKGHLDLYMVLNDNNEIAGMQWMPAGKKITGPKVAASAIKSNNPKQTPLERTLDTLAIGYLQDPANCGLSIAIIDGDKTDLYYYGTTSKNSDKLPDSASIYEIGSITKTFTGILLCHAINEGKVNPEDDIRKYLPGSYPNLEFQGKPITLKNLSNHTAGFPRMPTNFQEQKDYEEHDPFKNYTREQFLAYLRNVTLKAKPGTVSDYSNYGVALLGMIMENVYKKPFDELITTYVARPAGMKHTTCEVKGNDRTLLTTGYYEGKEWPYWTLNMFNPAGGLKSCIADMAAYIRTNMKERNPDFALSHQPTFTDGHNKIGFAWVITAKDNKETLIWHNGETGGFTGFAGYIRESNVGMVILSNSTTGVEYIANKVLVRMSASRGQ